MQHPSLAAPTLFVEDGHMRCAHTMGLGLAPDGRRGLMEPDWSDTARRMVDRIITGLKDNAKCFMGRVEEKAAPGYYKTIKKPMWIGLVQEKLNSGKYETPLDFCSDVRLIWSNCKSYHALYGWSTLYGHNNRMRTLAEQARQRFEYDWAASELGGTGVEPSAATPGAASGAPPNAAPIDVVDLVFDEDEGERPPPKRRQRAAAGAGVDAVGGGSGPSNSSAGSPSMSTGGESTVRLAAAALEELCTSTPAATPAEVAARRRAAQEAGELDALPEAERAVEQLLRELEARVRQEAAAAAAVREAEHEAAKQQMEARVRQEAAAAAEAREVEWVAEREAADARLREMEEQMHQQGEVLQEEAAAAFEAWQGGVEARQVAEARVQELVNENRLLKEQVQSLTDMHSNIVHYIQRGLKGARGRAPALPQLR
ncbi:Bromodomain and WD repeat domain-containing protein [Tetrabaena socialis]|uniref:Bromodomain and WD repeat domain-containing protein n=1 Tax=Tetrabaena socialis TaxID=47790 RepID=A0A2J8AI93_9CHLO|nr:Bromodomain and WD repeat domain-containing protein [Tetrabaena socialis]|eukprot:PNH12243.1 Bromodomain and WD repeat domain-containing protein [Tetrabaena socialis]